MKVKFWLFLSPPNYTNSQNSIISFGYVLGKNLLMLYPLIENSITHVTIIVHTGHPLNRHKSKKYLISFDVFLKWRWIVRRIQIDTYQFLSS